MNVIDVIPELEADLWLHIPHEQLEATESKKCWVSRHHPTDLIRDYDSIFPTAL
jgi:hypothetical protein